MASADPAPDAPLTSSTLGFLDGGGEMGSCIRAFDWSTHPLGPIEAWPVALRIALSLCLHSSFPTSIYWGPELYLFYNDAWIPVDGDRHPRALGRPGATVRYDVWNVIGPQIAAVLETGKGFFAVDRHLPMVRNGAAIQSYWTYSLSPI